MKKNKPSENHNKRAPCEEVLGADVADDQRPDSGEEQHKPSPAPLRYHGGQVASAPPDQEAAEQGNQESVGVIGVVPPLRDQISEGRPVEPCQDCHEDQPEQTRPDPGEVVNDFCLALSPASY